MSSDSTGPALVFDHGSRIFKAGLCLDNTPSIVEPTVTSNTTDETMYAMAYHTLSLSSSSSSFSSSSHPAVLANDSTTPYTHLETTASIFFEKFGSPSLLFEKSPVLSLYSVGRTNGISVDSGYATTKIVHAWQGFVVDYTATNNSSKAGQHVNMRLREVLLADDGVGLDDEDVVDDIKESCCFVSDILKDDGSSSMDDGKEKDYELPDGKVLKLKAEDCASAGEVLFRSDSWGGLGVHEAVQRTIGRCDDDLRAGLYGQIVLSGGTTMLSGYAARLQKELESNAPVGVRVNIIASPARKYAAWIGGAIAGRDSTLMKHMAVTKAEYEEAGGSIIRRKFIGYPSK
ncbi:actin family [Cladorrhinum sp. PSN259]|nr:actin family [Cladorrhinum sp. PSN259]